MSKQILICIGAGHHQRASILTGQRLGYHVVAVDRDPLAESLALADTAIVANAHDTQASWEALSAAIDLERVSGVVTQAARGCIRTAAAIAARLRLPHLGLDVATRSLRKNELIRRFHPELIQCDVRSPDFDPCDIDFPGLLKWDNTSGGSGLRMVDDCHALLEIIHDPVTAFPFSIHRVLTGRHLGVVGLRSQQANHIVGIVEQVLDDGLKLQEISLPANLETIEEELVLDFTRDVLSELGLNLGPYQLEVILTPDRQVYFVELEPSILGSYISERMIPLAGGSDYVADAIRVLTEPDFVPVERKLNQTVTNTFIYGSEALGEIAAGMQILRHAANGHPLDANQLRANVIKVMSHAG